MGPRTLSARVRTNSHFAQEALMDTSTVTASQIMTAKLVSTTPDSHVLDAIDLLTDHRVSGLPVLDETGQYVGRFSDRSAISALDLGTIRSSSAICRRMTEITASDLVNVHLPVLQAEDDVFHCINELVSQRVSGAPVVNASGQLCGVFSEQSAMHIYIGLCWEQLPSAQATAWLDRHEDRRISPSASLDEILERFQVTPYRRLMVVQGMRFIGQVTRQDALKAARQISQQPITVSQSTNGERQLGLKTNVGAWMQMKGEQLAEQEDVLSITQKFINFSARQLPVIRDGHMSGQVSRSDLLRAVQQCFPEPKLSGAGPAPLYISSLNRYGSSAIS